jgi:hypothetical protein
MLKFKLLPILAATAAALMLSVGMATPASADLFDFTSDHCTGGCGTSPFGSVMLTQNGTSVDVVVTLFNGSEFIQTGAGDNYLFKFDASSGITNADITITSPTSPTLSVVGPGSFDGDGTGDYDFGICHEVSGSCSNTASSPIAGPIDFTVANATTADLEIVNDAGFLFTADIKATNGNTGPVAVVPAPPIGHGLPVFLAVGALLFCANLWSRRTRNGLSRSAMA